MQQCFLGFFSSREAREEREREPRKKEAKHKMGKNLKRSTMNL